MALTSMTVLAVGVLMVTLAFNLISGWTLDPMCPGTDTFCDGVWWRTVVEHLPTWLFMGQIMVVLALASPFVLR